MAQITLTIADSLLNRVLDGFAAQHDYVHQKLEGETKAQFLKRRIIAFVKASVVLQESQDALTAAEIQAKETANNEIIVT